jgi:hypothetical protein
MDDQLWSDARIGRAQVVRRGLVLGRGTYKLKVPVMLGGPNLLRSLTSGEAMPLDTPSSTNHPKHLPRLDTASLGAGRPQHGVHILL